MHALSYCKYWSLEICAVSSLAKELRKHGIHLDTIASVKYVGDESSGTGGVEVIERDREEIAWLWQHFEHAEPYAFWVASGNRRVEIYLHGEIAPATTLFVNETDSTSARGIPGRFMCHGCEELIYRRLCEKTDCTSY